MSQYENTLFYSPLTKALETLHGYNSLHLKVSHDFQVVASDLNVLYETKYGSVR